MDNEYVKSTKAPQPRDWHEKDIVHSRTFPSHTRVCPSPTDSSDNARMTMTKCVCKYGKFKLYSRVYVFKSLNLIAPEARYWFEETEQGIEIHFDKKRDKFLVGLKLITEHNSSPLNHEASATWSKKCTYMDVSHIINRNIDRQQSKVYKWRGDG